MTTKSPPETSTSKTARAVWFGRADAPLFGVLHPAVDDAKDVVVVMCNPFGYDAINTHYGYQRLAESLARAGVTTLRFDYLGTGDSAGEDEAPDHLANWLTSIGEAIAEARRSSGASKVMLFGVRLGALLATAYAEKSPVDGLILLGPPRSGAGYVRELSALNSIRAANPRDQASPDIEFPEDESDGYPLPSELRAAIAALDPNAFAGKPAERALVIGRDDLPGREARFIERLRELGVDVESSQAPGYRNVFGFRTLPQETSAAIIRWILEPPSGAIASLGASRRAAPNEEPAIASFDGFSEEAVTFGGLFGILTHPAQDTALRETGVLLLGTGNNPHVGLNRMHVTFARALAARGFRVLRFDLSGVGESPARPRMPDRVFYTHIAVPETRMAIDFMMSRGVSSVALFGLCSGAYTAFHTAVIDGRVSAIMPVNSPGFLFNPIDAGALAVSSRAPWMPTRPTTPSGRVPTKVSPVNRAGNRASFALDARDTRYTFPEMTLDACAPPPTPWVLLDRNDEVARGFGRALERRTKTFLVYGSGDVAHLVFEAHVGADNVKRGVPNLDVALVAGTNHTFTPRLAQKRLLALVMQFFDHVA